jgi:hypothetical protein
MLVYHDIFVHFYLCITGQLQLYYWLHNYKSLFVTLKTDYVFLLNELRLKRFKKLKVYAFC